MTHKFKFGDKVRHQYDPELTGVVIVPVTISGITIVWFDGDQSCSDFNAEDLEPIPHPDTVRLNWLENETKMVGDSVHFGHDGVHFLLPGDECEQENFVNLREAIDFLTKL